MARRGMIHHLRLSLLLTMLLVEITRQTRPPPSVPSSVLRSSKTPPLHLPPRNQLFRSSLSPWQPGGGGGGGGVRKSRPELRPIIPDGDKTFQFHLYDPTSGHLTQKALSLQEVQDLLLQGGECRGGGGAVQYSSSSAVGGGAVGKVDDQGLLDLPSRPLNNVQGVVATVQQVISSEVEQNGYQLPPIPSDRIDHSGESIEIPETILQNLLGTLPSHISTQWQFLSTFSPPQTTDSPTTTPPQDFESLKWTTETAEMDMSKEEGVNSSLNSLIVDHSTASTNTRWNSRVPAWNSGEETSDENSISNNDSDVTGDYHSSPESVTANTEIPTVTEISSDAQFNALSQEQSANVNTQGNHDDKDHHSDVHPALKVPLFSNNAQTLVDEDPLLLTLTDLYAQSYNGNNPHQSSTPPSTQVWTTDNVEMTYTTEATTGTQTYLPSVTNQQSTSAELTPGYTTTLTPSTSNAFHDDNLLTLDIRDPGEPESPYDIIPVDMSTTPSNDLMDETTPVPTTSGPYDGPTNLLQLIENQDTYSPYNALSESVKDQDSMLRKDMTDEPSVTPEGDHERPVLNIRDLLTQYYTTTTTTSPTTDEPITEHYNTSEATTEHSQMSDSTTEHKMTSVAMTEQMSESTSEHKNTSEPATAHKQTNEPTTENKTTMEPANITSPMTEAIPTTKLPSSTTTSLSPTTSGKPTSVSPVSSTTTSLPTTTNSKTTSVSPVVTPNPNAASPLSPIITPNPNPASPLSPVVTRNPNPASPLSPVVTPNPNPASPLSPIVTPNPNPASPLSPIVTPISNPASPLSPVVPPNPYPASEEEPTPSQPLDKPGYYSNNQDTVLPSSQLAGSNYQDRIDLESLRVDKNLTEGESFYDYYGSTVYLDNIPEEYYDYNVDTVKQPAFNTSGDLDFPDRNATSPYHDHHHHHGDHHGDHHHGDHHHGDHHHGDHHGIPHIPPPENPADLLPAPADNPGLEASVEGLDPEIRKFVDVMNDITFKVYKLAARQHRGRNFVMSPLSLVSTLGMLLLGARGRSAGALSDLLKTSQFYTFNPHLVLKNVTQAINELRDVHDVAFLRHFLVETEKNPYSTDFYAQTIKVFYDAMIEDATPSELDGRVRAAVNAAVANRTDGRVKQFLQKDEQLFLTPPLSTIATSFLHAKWSQPVVQQDLVDMSFIRFPTAQRRLIQTVGLNKKMTVNAGYSRAVEATAAEIPLYSRSGELSLVLVMPGEQKNFVANGLTKLESGMNPRRWGHVMRSMLPNTVNFKMPVFRHRAFHNFSTILADLGLAQLFKEGEADFSGINHIRNLHLSDVVQLNEFQSCMIEDASSTVPLQRMARSASFYKDSNAHPTYIYGLPMMEYLQKDKVKLTRMEPDAGGLGQPMALKLTQMDPNAESLDQSENLKLTRMEPDEESFDPSLNPMAGFKAKTKSPGEHKRGAWNPTARRSDVAEDATPLADDPYQENSRTEYSEKTFESSSNKVNKPELPSSENDSESPAEDPKNDPESPAEYPNYYEYPYYDYSPKEYKDYYYGDTEDRVDRMGVAAGEEETQPGTHYRQNDVGTLAFDRAFLYAVRHNPTGLLLFLGRYLDPEGN